LRYVHIHIHTHPRGDTMSVKAKHEILTTLQKLGPALVDDALAAAAPFVPAAAAKAPANEVCLPHLLFLSLSLLWWVLSFAWEEEERLNFIFLKNRTAHTHTSHTHTYTYIHAQKFIRAVQYCALQRFERTLPTEMKERAAKTLGVAAGELVTQLADVDVDLFVNSAGTDLLRAYATRLNLEDTNAPRDVLRRNVADEIMLTGTECFLVRLPLPLLIRLCEALNVGATERARPTPQTRELVEALMVYIFQLDPITTPATGTAATGATTTTAASTAAAAPPDKKRKSSTKLTTPTSAPSKPKSKKNKEKDTHDRDTVSDKEKKRKKKKDKEERKEKEKEKEDEESVELEKKKSKSGGATGDDVVPRGYYDKDRQWVCPPFEAVVAGKYDYQGLYDNFNMDDLVRFCKQHGIKPGKKSVCIRSILAKFPHKK